jgi:ferredoxin like protein
MNRSSIQEKVGLNKYEIDEGNSHIRIDQEKCANCAERPCLYICPAGVYSERNGDIIPEFAACLECGTCRVACANEGLTWFYPRGSFGVIYRQG